MVYTRIMEMEGYFLHLANKIDKHRRPSVNPRKEWRSLQLWRSIFAEFTGTWFYHFLGCSSTVMFGPVAETMGGPLEITSEKICFAFGLAVTGMIEVFGPVSGAHFNPAVSLAMTFSRDISVLRFLMYTVAQCAGAITSSAVLYGLTPEKFRGNLGGNLINPHMTYIEGFVTEIFYTCFLVLVIYGSTNRNRPSAGLPSLIIGLTVAATQMGGITYSSCSMNPARSLGPAIFAGLWENHWVFWVGPFAGAAMASLIYTYIIDPYRGTKSFEEAIAEMSSVEHGLANRMPSKSSAQDIMVSAPSDQGAAIEMAYKRGDNPV